MTNIQNRKNNKEYFIKEDNNIIYFLLINDGKSSNLIGANIIKDNEQKERNYNIINFKENIKEKEIENNTNLINGIIFISSDQKNKNLAKIIEYIYQIDKKIKKVKLVPKIIFENKDNIIKSLKSSKEIEHFNKLRNIKFIEILNDHNEIINLALKELIKMKNMP